MLIVLLVPGFTFTAPLGHLRGTAEAHDDAALGVFGLPLRLIEYVLVHEQAHATQPSGAAHGRAWKRQMYLWMPDWQRPERTRRGRPPRLAWRLEPEVITTS
ncbi:hypothetical protein ALI144C_07020 [Actinosynnema sp. ALI-1.44]|uniref:YgjP-like metallopeptidase domain-containing protein n=1 Tax=Actinosynnema sp. ALI-1.44 TaxID=1933779 RepID=UPI00097C48D2|nr:YgjP-like metallopeptidase domain-containing protein [Actinosynnema sp. ALI-1.44]ONI88199.1 hypothetical protein ALI144C_07020 [Actinosynnema sp. ALI-1.44]